SFFSDTAAIPDQASATPIRMITAPTISAAAQAGIGMDIARRPATPSSSSTRPAKPNSAPPSSHIAERRTRCSFSSSSARPSAISPRISCWTSLARPASNSPMLGGPSTLTLVMGHLRHFWQVSGGSAPDRDLAQPRGGETSSHCSAYEECRLATRQLLDPAEEALEVVAAQGRGEAAELIGATLDQLGHPVLMAFKLLAGT